MIEIEQYERYYATVRIRRTDHFAGVVKPEAEQYDGRRVLVTAGWHLEEMERCAPDGSPLYRAEWAMVLGPEDEIGALGWIASGDLVDLVHLPYRQGALT